MFATTEQRRRRDVPFSRTTMMKQQQRQQFIPWWKILVLLFLCGKVLVVWNSATTTVPRCVVMAWSSVQPPLITHHNRRRLTLLPPSLFTVNCGQYGCRSTAAATTTQLGVVDSNAATTILDATSFLNDAFMGAATSTLTLSSLSLTSDTMMMMQSATTTIAVAAAVDSVTSVLLSSSTFWSAIVMILIVLLLYIWEEAVATARHKLGSTLMPVVDGMLAEMGGLGFIGLFLSVVVTSGGPLGSTIGSISETWLGDEHILLETFEFLHTAFFEVGIGFFVVAGLTVAVVLEKITSLRDFTRIVLDRDGNGMVSLDELADCLQVQSFMIDVNNDGTLDESEIQTALRSIPKVSLWNEITISTETIQAEALVLRERFLRTNRVKPNFRIETYCEKIFGRNLKEMVELSPLTWIPLIPALSLGRAVDMSRDVVSAASPNAAESCGYFLGSSLFFTANTILVIVGWIWCGYNFWKMAKIKQMLVPLLVRDTSSNNQPPKATLLPPRYEDSTLLSEFNSSPSIFGWIERYLFGAPQPPPPRHNTHEQLFGVVGAAGPELYSNSIKFHSWFIVCQIVFYGTQIVARDMTAVWMGQWESMGNPDLVIPELILFGWYVVLAMVQLSLAPTTFLNYSLITSVEQLTDETAVAESYCTMMANIDIDTTTSNNNNDTNDNNSENAKVTYHVAK